MARTTVPLSDTKLKSAKPKDKDYTLQDGNGLYLLIKTTGSKIWRFNYYRPITKKRALISFGSYPTVSLLEARLKRENARELLAKNIDPQEHKKAEEQRLFEEKNNTFEKIAQQWFEIKSKSSLQESTLKDIWRSLELHVLPHVGDIAITDLKARHFISALEPLKAQGKLESVKRVAQRINEVMFYAVNVGFLDANPAAKITAAFENPVVKNLPALKPDQLPELMAAIQGVNIERQTYCLLQWQLLTITRPAEAAEAAWCEIDLDNKLWTIPPARMKMKREHIIPLSPQALAILETMKPISGHREHIFPSMKSPHTKPMNSQTVNAAIKRVGFAGRLVAHGFRSIASTALNEHGFQPDVIEAALAHIDSNEVRRAYNRAIYLEQRREMMDWWGEFVKNAINNH
ncbi:integrase domain-containing protein [Providencia stuartii]|uniref:integrase domain-containing protein n=1 Tax=Providencia stuartii TaxID=588 RepID=UPI001BCCAC5E|nr:integrase domain-containing protein [Providencia thailandensis]MBS7784455.1 tyrosine-type recombinase/integrase [Providencia thailandensis]